MECQGQISKDFLEEILHQRIKSFQVKAGSNPGDNFTSVLHSIEVQVHGNEQPLYLVMKIYPTLEARQKFLNETNLFKKEIQVYTDFIPDLITFQGKICDDKLIKPALPPYVAGVAIDFTKEDLQSLKKVSPFDNYLVMIDVRKTSGFQMVDKTLGLDFEHMALAMKELAKLHALGWALKQKENLTCLQSKYPFLHDMCFSRENSNMESLIDSNFQMVVNIAKRHFPVGSRALLGLEKIKNTGPLIILDWFMPKHGRVQEAIVRDYLRGVQRQTETDEPWLVSCHGDAWMNNMLFSYNKKGDGSSPTDVMFVDLQMYREGCPTTDLSYMFYSSTTYETRKQHLEALLKIYYDHFISYCNTVGVQPLKNFTFPSLLKRFHRAKILGFITSILILPIILSHDSSKDLDTVKSGDDATQDGAFSDVLRSLTSNAENNERLAKRITEIISELVESNIF